MKNQPKITVGVMDKQTEILGRLNGTFKRKELGPLSGGFSVKGVKKAISLFDESHREIGHSPLIRLTPQKDATFSLFNVTIGNRFHWEKKEDQTFQGDLILCLREDGTIAAINEIPLEDYLKSVISSEMSAQAPIEFLKAHAILSRSWILSAIDLKRKKEIVPKGVQNSTPGEFIHWYDREDHELYDVCSDDHCQRYQGMAKEISKQIEEAVCKTQGWVITFNGKICDTRYSKACGGITEEFSTAWEDKQIPYLKSISDGFVPHQPIKTEEEASAWIASRPEAYCNIKDERLIEKILPDLDRETRQFFRWRVEYSQEELNQILREKSGFDFGTLKEIVPLARGPSGRIYRCKIVGSKKSIVIGKELEIRRWLSRTHLYSSAFVVRKEGDRFIFNGAGWGHGVGLCQIGAAVMAHQGFSAEKILRHYFAGIEIKKIY